MFSGASGVVCQLVVMVLSVGVLPVSWFCSYIHHYWYWSVNSPVSGRAVLLEPAGWHEGAGTAGCELKRVRCPQHPVLVRGNHCAPPKCHKPHGFEGSGGPCGASCLSGTFKLQSTTGRWSINLSYLGAVLLLISLLTNVKKWWFLCSSCSTSSSAKGCCLRLCLCFCLELGLGRGREIL